MRSLLSAAAQADAVSKRLAFYPRILCRPLSRLRILGGGAVKGLVAECEVAFRGETGAVILGDFGPVGDRRDRVVAGEACDIAILSAKLIDELADSGHVLPHTKSVVGTVGTAVAVKTGVNLPDIGSTEALAFALRGVELFVPNLRSSTAGRHIAIVLGMLDLQGDEAPNVREFSGGQAAMKGLATANGVALGCTQATEILATPGISLVGELPEMFRLRTTYVAAVCTGCTELDLARKLVQRISSADVRETRERLGFQV